MKIRSSSPKKAMKTGIPKKAFLWSCLMLAGFLVLLFPLSRSVMEWVFQKNLQKAAELWINFYLVNAGSIVLFFIGIGWVFYRMSARSYSMPLHALDERQEKESILDLLIEGVCILDQKGTICFVNPTFAKIVGFSRHELLGQNIEAFPSLKKEPLAHCQTLIKLAQHEETVVTDSIILEEKQKVFLDLIVASKPLNDRVIIITQDTSSQHQVVEIGKEFIANASHELRTPITIIKGFAETLHDLPTISPSMLHEITGKIVRSCERMDALIKSLLILSDLDRVPRDKFQPCDLGLLIESCVRHLKFLLPEVHVFIEKPQEIVLLNANLDLLELVLMNLLENGAKYSSSPAKLTLALEQTNHEVSLSVQDKGMGIPAKDLPHIFERFYTVNQAHSRRLGGAGLGLSIVKTIIDKHKGTISVTSTPGKGSTFTIVLPKNQSYRE